MLQDSSFLFQWTRILQGDTQKKPPKMHKHNIDQIQEQQQKKVVTWFFH